MKKRFSKIAGFMSAESIYSLAFYIVMVAAIAGVGAAVLSKSSSAKAVAALSLIRANYQQYITLNGYPTTQPSNMQMAVMSGHLLTPRQGVPAAELPGVAIYSITNRVNPVAFSINVSEIKTPDLCKAVGGVGWGTWGALVKGILLSTAAIPSSSAQPGFAGSGIINTKNGLHTICNAAEPNMFVQLTFISN